MKLPTREEAIAKAAHIYLEARIRIETERAVAAAQAEADARVSRVTHTQRGE